MLGDIFPYFCDERYIGFLVTTQSCDLVRRGTNPCKAKYISLAVIRELSPLLPEILEEVCGTGFPGIYKKEARFLAEQLLIRIINQNEQSRGVFYLHQDADVAIATSSVALLRVTFALKQQHYELLIRARRGRVRAEYANKLGWLSGNLFSRVATPDWEDQEEKKNASKEQAQQLLQLATEANDQNWVSGDWIKEAERKNIDLGELSPENAYAQLEAHAPPEPIDIVLRQLEKIGRELLAERELKLDLKRSEGFLKTFSQRILEVVNDLTDAERKLLVPQLLENDDFCMAVCQSVSSEAKKQFKASTSEPVKSLLERLAGKKGTIKPVLDHFKKAIDLIAPQKSLDLKDDVHSANLFDSNVLEHIQAVAEAIESEHTERQKELSGRLRSDPHIKTALRNLTQT